MPAILMLVAAVLAVVGTVLLFIFVLPGDKRAALPTVGKWIHDFLNFKSLIVEAVLKFLYILSTIFVILTGIFTLFTENYFGQSNAVKGLLTIVLGPLTVRLGFELLMLLILLTKNVIGINRRLASADETIDDIEFKPGLRALLRTEPDVVETVETDVTCPSCGGMVAEEQPFCSTCGNKLG